MLARIDKLAELGTSVVAFSGGEPMLHPDLDALIRRIRSHGMIAGLITNGYLLFAEADSGAERRRAGLPADQHRQRRAGRSLEEEPARSSTRSCSGSPDTPHFDVNINSVVGGGIKNPEDARTINRRARELGFSTSIGIIHDGSGILKPLGSAERAVFDDVMRLDQRPQAGLQEPLLRHPQLPGQPRRRQAERVELPRRRAISVHLRERPRPLVLATARRARRAARRLFGRGHPPRAPRAQMVRAALHDRLRPPRVAHGLLAEAAEAGTHRPARLRQRSVLNHRMANTVSFDITSGVDIQEVDNAVNQAKKEVAQRYDFKGSRASIELNREENTLTLTADDDYKMTALWEILQGRLVRRGVPTKNLTPGETERAANDTVKRVVTLQQGIPTEAAKEIVKFLKDNKLKTRAGRDSGGPGPDLVGVEGRPAGSDAPAARARLRRRAAVRQLPRLTGGGHSCHQ